MLEWGAEHRRDLPWRRTRDPWLILVSEVMLQQTQVDRVVPHYERFAAAFPTPDACARAGPAAVVRRWSGLGYNRRALNLHRAAGSVVADHGGSVPREDAALRALAGVGPYTARAVRSFAFGDDVAAVDTNAVRVLARGVAGTALTPALATGLGDRLVPAGRSWEFNQTMFDLGATVCSAARPDCARLPSAPPVLDGAAGAVRTRGELGPTVRPQARSPARTAKGADVWSRRCATARCRRRMLAVGLRMAR